MGATSLRTLLSQGPLPVLERRMLWCHVLDVTPTWLIAHDDTLPELDKLTRYLELESRRIKGEPMAYILGQREFMGHVFLVTEDVLIPRPETELLVEVAIERIDKCRVSAVPVAALDLGTGSGAVAVSLALSRPNIAVSATDISAAALDIAGSNAKRLGAEVEFFQGNWYHALPAQRAFDVIVSNPPYIAASDSHLLQGDLRFEPKQALTDYASGLQALECIIMGASAHLRPGGALFVEHGWDQADAVSQRLEQAGFRQVSSQRDLAGIARVTGGFL